MWLFTQHGFYSIVAKDDGFHHVRSHAREDLESLLKVVGIRLTVHESRSSKYRYRLLVDIETLLEIMVHLTTDLDYPEFKQQLAKHPRQRPRLDTHQAIDEAISEAAHLWDGKSGPGTAS